MSGFRFSTRTVFIAITLVATYVAASRKYQDWFAQSYPNYDLNWKLSKLQNGMSFERVQSSFSCSTRLQPSDIVDLGPTEGGRIRHKNGIRNASPHLINMVNGLFKKMASGDELYLFDDVSGSSAYLQFRDGVLVNHNPALYVPTPELAKLNRIPFPNLALRFGLLPYFVLLVITVLCITRWRQRRQSQARRFIAES